MVNLNLRAFLYSLSEDQLLRAVGRTDWTDSERAIVDEAWARRQVITYEEDLVAAAAGMSTDELLRQLLGGMAIEPELCSFAEELRRRASQQVAAK